jgi:hypothetical protein
MEDGLRIIKAGSCGSKTEPVVYGCVRVFIY